MITDDELDQRLSEAFSRFDELPAELPESAMSAGSSGERGRRLVAAAAAVIAIAGVVGVTQLSGNDTPTTADVEGTAPITAFDPQSDTPNATAPNPTNGDVPVVPLVDAPFRCRGFIGTQNDGRIYDDCEPMIEYVMVDYVCTGYAGTDAAGYDSMASCDAIAATSNVPGINSLPPEIITTGPGDPLFTTFETATYVIQPGDIPLEVAEAHCLTLNQLEALNDDDALRSFAVGTPILVRAKPATGPCTFVTEQTYVVQSGDWPLRVAGRFCISIDELVAYNGWSSIEMFPFPGEAINIPPGACAGNSVGTYVIRPDDTLALIAEKFCVTNDEIVTTNGWTPDEGLPPPTNTILIPQATRC